MRKSFVALALLVGAAAFMANLAFAQTSSDPGNKLVNAKERLTRASRLGTFTGSGQETTWVGHTLGTPTSGAPWFIGRGPNNPGLSHNGIWDFDHFNAGENDSLQGWWPIRRIYAATAGLTVPDIQRPWWAIDIGNMANYKLYSTHQARTVGVNGVWHVDPGNNTPGGQAGNGTVTWAPLAGNASAWCGLRCASDLTAMDAAAQGGYGNAFNQDVIQWLSETSTLAGATQKQFPGYANQWDQILYRDVRVANGASLTIGYKFRTKMSTTSDPSSATRTGWFDKDPLSLGLGNFISSSNAGASAPRDSFMVYVGCPVDPTDVTLSDGSTGNVVYDLKRRWFSEVIAINKPYHEITSVAGNVVNLGFNVVLPNAVVQPMLDADGGSADGGGIVRLVFRSKTNRGWSDQDGGTTSYSSGTEGAVRIDDVTVTGGTPAINSGFETAAEINNAIEAPNAASPGPAVGQGYALGTWKSTGKPPGLYFHTHPLLGGDIGGGNFYTPLAYNDLCGAPDSPARGCNIDGVVVSLGDHDRGEASGGVNGTAFQEISDGIVSPTINLCVPAYPGQNEIGIDLHDREVTDDYYWWYDLYAGIFNLNFTGNAWLYGAQSYPGLQPNGVQTWTDMRFPTFQIFNPEPQCFWDIEPLYGYGLIATTHPSGYPDSLRVIMGHNQQCFRFAVSLGCSPTGGAYYDNVSLGFVNVTAPLATAGTGSLGSMTVDIWQWYNDAFPANETPGLPGTAAFDTTGAWLQTGINTAQSTGNANRFDIPGDTVMIKANFSEPTRVDMIFRVFPGPGNYVVAGNKASGLRQVPQSATPAVAGDNSFWGQYLASPDGGSGFGKGAHVGNTWDVNVWNAARCDTAELNYFPVKAKGNLPAIDTKGTFASMYHESDPKFSVLGIVKNRCFLVDTAGSINSTNTTCGSGTYPPAWVTTVPPSRTGYNGVTTTIEYTKIIQDGLLTAGSHVEYFFRKSTLANPSVFVAVPDTQYITPQNGEGPSTDAHRWQQFGVLPDRWKDPAYGGIGSACMLVVDWADRRGGERVWVSVADTIGATAANKYGAHNGWHCTGAFSSPADGSQNYTGDIVGGDPTIAIWSHGGNPGTTWDFYQVKASESLSTQAGALGSRLSNRAGMGLAAGKSSRQGPTPEMLRTYYKLLYILCGDMNSGLLGPFVNRSQNDVGLIQDFMTFGANPLAPRGVGVMGDGFVQSETQTAGVDPQHGVLLTTNFALSLRDASYQSVSGNLNDMADLMPTSVVTGGRADVFGTQNTCAFSNDLLNVNAAVPGATVGTYYQNVGTNGPYVASVYAPSTASHPYITLVDGWEIRHLRSRFDENSMGRIVYFMDMLVNVFGSICPFTPTPTVDVPQMTGTRTVNFVNNIFGNPLRSGYAVVSFSLAKADRVEVKVYDVTGRLVRTLADRSFEAGPQTLKWDGTNDQGQSVSRGVYFTQVKFLNSRFTDAKKVTVLK